VVTEVGTEMRFKMALTLFSLLWFIGIVLFNLVSMYGVYVMTDSVWDALNWPSGRPLFELVIAVPMLAAISWASR
jgi:uncharacterized SAM-binding protein YcdF (DUF218 family)